MRYSAHHILFTRRNWNKGYRRRLRKLFIYEIPDEVHKKLHKFVAPVPPITDIEAIALLNAYPGEMELFDALEWLAYNASDQNFSTAILAQLGFLKNELSD